MRIINSNTLTGADFSFGIKIIDIDFYNTTDRTLFLGYSGDNYFTQLHLIIPEEYMSDLQDVESWGVYVSFYNDTLQQHICTIPIYPSSDEYYVPLTNGDILNKAYKGKLQFFIQKKDNSQTIIASSQKIPYIVEESLEKELDPEYVSTIEEYWNNHVSDIQSMLGRISVLENNVGTLQSNIQSKADKPSASTAPNKILLSSNNGNYVLSNIEIGGNNFVNSSARSSKVATEKGVESYVNSELNKLPNLTNGMKYQFIRAAELDTNTNSKYIYGTMIGNTYGLVLNSHVATHISQFFFGSLGAIKVRTKRSGESWGEWHNYGVDEGEHLTPELIEKINAALTEIPDYVERNTNKIRTDYNYQFAAEDFTNYPSMATLWDFKQRYIDHLYDDMDDLEEEMSNLDTSKINKLNSIYANQVPLINSQGELKESSKFVGNSAFRQSGNDSILATERGVIDYINNQNFAKADDLENIDDLLKSSNNLINLNSSLSDAYFTINKNYIIISNGTSENLSLENFADEILLDEYSDYFVGFKTENNLDYDIEIITNVSTFNVNSSVIADTYFFKISTLLEDSLQFNLTINEDVNQPINMYFYLFKSNDINKKIIEDVQSNLNRIKILEREEQGDPILKNSKLVSFKEFETLTNKILTNSDNNFIILEDSKISKNGLNVSNIGNYFILNGILTEETTFTFLVKNTENSVSLSNDVGPETRYCHSIFCNVKYNESNDILPIEGSVTYYLNTRHGRSDITANFDFNNNYINNDISAISSSFTTSQGISSVNPGEELQLTISPGTYNNETFYFISQVNWNYINTVISDILNNDITPFMIKKEVLPQEISDAPVLIQNLEQQIENLQEEVDDISIDKTTLEDYGIEDAYTKEEIDLKEKSFLEPSYESRIALKNKIYKDGNITVEVTDWGIVHIFGSGEASILLETIYSASSHYLNSIYIENISEAIEEDIVSLNFSYINNLTPVFYNYELPNREEGGTYLYPRTMISGPAQEFKNVSINIADNEGIDYTFAFKIFYSNSHTATESPVMLSTNLTSGIYSSISSSYYSLSNDKVSKSDLYTSSSNENLLQLVNKTYDGYNNWHLIVSDDYKLSLIPEDNSNFSSKNVQLELSNGMITLEPKKTYDLSVSYNNNNSRSVIFRFYDDEDNLIKSLTCNNASGYKSDSIYVRGEDEILIEKIECIISGTNESLPPEGEFFLSIRPVDGIIKESALGLERFIENGTINTPLINSNDTAYRMAGNYRLKDGFCYLTVSAHLRDGWTNLSYNLPVPAIKNATSLISNGTRLYEVTLGLINTGATTTYLTISPIENKMYPSPSSAISAAEGYVYFTFCYRYQ